MFNCCIRHRDKRKNSVRSRSLFRISITNKSYTLKGLKKDNMMNQKYSFIHNYSINSTQKYNWIKVEAYKTSLNKISIMYIINNNCKNNLTLLISKNLSHDLGKFYPYAIDISTQLKINIISYDYETIMDSRSEQTIEKIALNTEEVLSFCLKELCIPIDKIILFGYSIGSLPSVNIGANAKYSNVKGLILMSMFSFESHFDNKISSKNQDQLKDTFQRIICPVFLIHGVKDKINPLREVQRMSKSFKKIYTWFPKKGDHENIFLRYRMEFMIQMKVYINSIISPIKGNQLFSNMKLNFEEDLIFMNDNNETLFQSLKTSDLDNKYKHRLSRNPFTRFKKYFEDRIEVISKQEEVCLMKRKSIISEEV